MATTYYHTVEGRIRGQSTAGVRTDYLTDALGSVVATVNSTAAVVNTYRYKPYGERLAKTGVGADPRFGWTGDTGSRRTERIFSDQHNHTRHFSTITASWATRDALWPIEPGWVYSADNPITSLDASGLAPNCQKECCCSVLDFNVDVRAIPQNPYRIGHYIVTLVPLEKRELMPGDRKADCSILWEERISRRFIRGQPEDHWYDVCTVKGLKCPTSDMAKMMPKGCPDYGVYQDVDEAFIVKVPKPVKTKERMLCIRITVTDGCTGKTRKWPVIKLYLQVEPEIVAVPPGHSNTLDKYCRATH